MDSEGIHQFAKVPSISIVVPIFKGEHTLSALVERINSTFFGEKFISLPLLSQVLFVCDDPEDHSEEILRSLQSSFPWINIISLSKNSGQHLASAVGFMYTQSDWVVTIDEDLHHPPELIVEMLKHALQYSHDLVYAKSTLQTHQQSFYRDIASLLSKKLLTFFSQQDFRSISSFRLVRGDVARAVASAADSVCYLDVDIFRYVSPKRISTMYSTFCDNRPNDSSGYNFLKLFRHYNRMIFSANLSLLSIIIAIACLFFLGSIIVIYSLFSTTTITGIQQVAPGWLSLFLLLISANLLLVFLLVYLIKTISTLIYRSNGYSSFLFVDRSSDVIHLKSITEAP